MVSIPTSHILSPTEYNLLVETRDSILSMASEIEYLDMDPEDIAQCLRALASCLPVRSNQPVRPLQQTIFGDFEYADTYDDIPF